MTDYAVLQEQVDGSWVPTGVASARTPVDAIKQMVVEDVTVVALPMMAIPLRYFVPYEVSTPTQTRTEVKVERVASKLTHIHSSA